MSDTRDIFPNGTIIHRKMTIIGVTVHVAYIKSRGEWFCTAGQPVAWDEIAQRPSYAPANHFRVKVPRESGRAAGRE